MILSSVLKSKKNIQENIAIMKTFVQIRQFALNYKELADKLQHHNQQFADVYEARDYLIHKDKIQTT